MRRNEHLVRTAKSLAARLNLDVHRRDLAHPARRVAAMRHAQIDLVLDVGANTGQYVTGLREGGYDGRVESFEAIPALVPSLRARAADDGRWRVHGYALGRVNELIPFHVSQDTVTSSALVAEDDLLNRISSAETAETIQVPCRTLADVWPEVTQGAGSIMLKIDVQGFEHAVLDGLAERIVDIALIEVEMGLVGLYEGGATVYDLMPRLHEQGFNVVSIDSGYVAQDTGQVLDIDMLMAR